LSFSQVSYKKSQDVLNDMQLVCPTKILI